MSTSGHTSSASGDGATATSAPDLVAVVRAVAGGDTAAFAYLYDALAPIAYGVAWRVLRVPRTAADVTQEVMLEIWRDSGRYVPERGTVHAWVATTAHRRAVDRTRSTDAERPRRDVEGIGSHRPDDNDDERRTERDHVSACLDALTDAQREVLVLAYFDGSTYREVADALGVDLPTVESRLRDGMTSLRTCLGVE